MDKSKNCQIIYHNIFLKIYYWRKLMDNLIIKNIMKGSPPSKEYQVSLDNWRNILLINGHL